MLAWLTPDLSALSESQEQRIVAVPGSLWSYISGALGELSRVEKWEQHGTATPEETSDFFLDVYEEFLVSNPYFVGELRAFIGSTLPSGWLAMDGVARLTADFPELAAVIPAGWITGANFTLPDMAAVSPVGEGTHTTTSFVLGATGGEKVHTLTTPEMPSHTHQYAMHTQNLTGASGTVLKPNATGQSLTTQATGGGGSHNNMQPYLVVKWAIFSG